MREIRSTRDVYELISTIFAKEITAFIHPRWRFNLFVDTTKQLVCSGSKGSWITCRQVTKRTHCKALRDELQPCLYKGERRVVRWHAAKYSESGAKPHKRHSTPSHKCIGAHSDQNGRPKSATRHRLRRFCRTEGRVRICQKGRVKRAAGLWHGSASLGHTCRCGRKFQSPSPRALIGVDGAAWNITKYAAWRGFLKGASLCRWIYCNLSILESGAEFLRHWHAFSWEGVRCVSLLHANPEAHLIIAAKNNCRSCLGFSYNQRAENVIVRLFWAFGFSLITCTHRELGHHWEFSL
jgi:hypothetical protein